MVRTPPCDRARDGLGRVGVGQHVAAEGLGLLDGGGDLVGSRTAGYSSGSYGEATPPETMILTWSAPWRICSRTALRTLSAPSAICG